ncbi:alpha-isopropylmalate synthase regulatory domain-containing protein [Gilliamella apicola]|nr:alpha-isopropylmalate synthase regulatory domain-containing protein [Gilliamella apicola]WLS91244.1 alpha-isopropylmalate synthase regulatory domain-containing protein [Gilliamella apicola]
MFDYDLEALIFINQLKDEKEHYVLDYFNVQSGSTVVSTASVSLLVGDKKFSDAATGNGPVDAVYQAINRITNEPIAIVKYQLASKGQGENALGQVDIVAEYKGRKFHGVGLATDIVHASALALINVLNNVYRANQVAQEKQKLHLV